MKKNFADVTRKASEPAEAPKPRKPETVKLTNKAGAFANPLAKDAAAWLKIGWYCA
tara:strand:- start:83 stop:250 length:168 start_codon:yes stop_codon:yes gene_type:complete